MRTVTRAIVATTTAIALTACGGGGGSTAIVVRMPPSEMALIGPSTLNAGAPRPTVRTIDGSPHTITGPIEKVEIDMKDKVVPVALPFKARVQDAQLEVLTDQVRTYPVQDVTYVQVQYGTARSSSGSRQGTSAGLLVGGLLCGGAGAALLIGSSNSGGGGFANLGGAFGALIGGGLAVAGVGLLIASVAVASSSASAQPAKTTKIQPKLHLSPTGGAVSFAF